MVIAAFYENKPPRPLRFQFEEQRSDLKIDVDRLISADIVLMGGKDKAYKFWCESVLYGVNKKYMLTYYFDSCKWYVQI